MRCLRATTKCSAVPSLLVRAMQRLQERPQSRCSRILSYWGAASIFGMSMYIAGMYVFVFMNFVVTINEKLCYVLMQVPLWFEMILILWSYWGTMRTPPPTVPDRFRLTAEETKLLERKNFDPMQIQMDLEQMAYRRGIQTRTMAGTVNFCYTCRLIKPERTHHCRFCATCVARMDHHCPYFRNCISYSNYKYFLLTLFHATIGCLYVVISSVLYMWISEKGFVKPFPTQASCIIFYFMIVLCGMLICLVGGFCGQHLYFTCHNLTNLEHLGGGVKFANGTTGTYDLGSRWLNWQQTCGPVCIAWFVPIPSSMGDGMTYPTRAKVPRAPPQDAPPEVLVE